MTDEKISNDVASVRKVGQYILGETLGKGGYSWVKKGIDENTNVPVALKFMPRAEKSGEKEQAKQVSTEIKSLIRLNHPNVMKLYAYNLNCKYPEKSGIKLSTILLVLEYCPGGELFDILYYTNQLDAKTARTYFIQMMNGIQACHDVGIVHRDIKPQNLLMDINFQLKLTDFGLSFLGRDGVDVNEIIMKTHYVGTRGYQAPELLKREAYKKACDIFSAGVVLFILLTGYPPFEQAIRTDKWFNPLANHNSEKFWKQHKGCGVDKDCMDLISKMLAYRACDRPSIKEILRHHWVNGPRAEVYTPKELSSLLKDRHRETRRRRRRDTKKMSDMQHSIKVKRQLNALTEFSDLPSCPVVSPKYYVPTWMSFTVKSEHLEEAYWLAKNVFDIAFKDQTFTKSSETDPWTLRTAIKVYLKKDIVIQYLVQIRIMELEGLGKHSFAFRRLQGDPLSFRKLWLQIEPLILAKKSADGKHLVFLDDYNECYDEGEVKSSGIDETKTMAASVSKEKGFEDVDAEVEDKVKTNDSNYSGMEEAISSENNIMEEVGVSV